MSGTEDKAVFLSYASQDAEAARRICESLRAAGVEVWFDQSELRGGDSWDAKIRRQIKECALFVPVISNNTQARSEGYFRLEWKLAADRSHLIARDHPFLVPVVIDETAGPSARVPEEFHAVQWTLLGDGTPAQAFWAQIRTLLDRNPTLGTKLGAAREVTSVDRRKSGWWIAAAVVTVGLAALWWSQKAARPAVPFQTVTPAPLSVLAASKPEVQKLLDRVWLLYERQNDATRDDWALAEDLAAQAAQLDPTSGEVAAAYAQVTLGGYIYGFKDSPAYLAEALKRAERAVTLAPDSVEARLSLANCLRFPPATRAEAERIAREVVAKNPTNKHALRVLANTLRYLRRHNEALEMLDRAIALPGGDANALAAKFVVYSALHRLDLAERVIDDLLVVRPGPFAYLKKASFALYLRGDFSETARMIDQTPGTFLFRDEGALLASQLHLWNGEPERALGILRSVGQEWLDARRMFNYFSPMATAPTAFLVGQAHALAGRYEAAQVQWQTALATIDAMLKRESTNPEYLWWRARLLACLGQRAEAERALRNFQEMVSGGGGVSSFGTNVAATTPALAFVWMPLGERDKVLEQAVGMTKKAINPMEAMFHLGLARNDPTFAPVREHPDFQAFIRHLEKMATARLPEK